MTLTKKRLRRLATRLVGWVIGVAASLVATILLAFAIFVLFFDYPDYLRSWMEGEATRILGTPVAIQSISVDLPNYAFVIQGVRVEPRGEAPSPLTIDSVRGELSPTGVFDRLLHLRSLHVDGFSLRVDDYGGGRIELPGHWVPSPSAEAVSSPTAEDVSGPTAEEAPSGETARAQFGFMADLIQFEDATFVYDNHNIPWRLEAQGLEAQMERTGTDHYQGRLRYERGEVRVKEREPVVASVETQFELEGREIRVSELSARGDFYRLVSRGKVTLGPQPEAEFTLNIESDVTPAARDLLGLPMLTSEPGAQRNPRATFEGTLLMGRGWHLVRGEASVPRARVAGVPLRGLRARVLWDRNVVELSSTEGFLGGGATTLRFRQAIPWTAEPAELELTVKDMLLPQIIESVAPQGERFGSRISGNLMVTFPLNDPSFATGRFSVNGIGEQELDLSALNFSASGTLDRGALRLDPSRLEADGVTALASGLYPRTESASLAFEVEAGDLARADRLQQSLRTFLHPAQPARLFGLSGSGRARGTLRGRLPSLVFDGDASGRNVLFRRIQWGDVEASGSASTELLHFTSFRSRNGGGTLRGNGTFGLTRPESPPGTLPSGALLGREFEVDVAVESWPAGDLDPVLGLSIGLQGAVSGTGKFSSHDGVLQGNGDVSVSAGSFRGHAFDAASAHIAVLDGNLLLDELAISQEAARLGGRVQLSLDSLAIDGELHAEQVPLPALGPMPFDLDGDVQGTLQLGGSLTKPSADLEAEIVGLRAAGLALGTGRVHGQLRDQTLRGGFSVEGAGMELEADLGVQGTRPMRLEGRARWSGGDLAPWLRRTLPKDGPELPASLRLVSAGDASFSGALDSLESFSATVSLSSLAVEAADYQLKAPKPFTLELARGDLRLEELDLVGEGTELRIAGGAHLAASDMELAANGAVNLAVFDALFSSMSWSGNANLAARLHGEWSRPELTGSIDLSDGAVSFRSFPQAIADIHGRVLFDNRTVRLSGIAGRFGGAPVALTGTLSLNRLQPESFDLNASGKGTRLRYPEGLVAEADAELRLTGNTETQLLSGQVDVHEATWSREYDLAAGILGSRDVLDFTEEPEESSFPDLRLDIRVNIPENLRVHNSLAVIDGRAELQLRGTLGRPALLGRAEAVKGEVFLLGQRYDIISGKVEFIDPNSIRPFFDLTAETRVRSYTVELRLAGTPDRFFPELSSDPPLRTVEILRLLAGATERELRLGSEEEEVAGVGVASLLTERLNQELSRRAERLFGLDRISIDPFLVGQFSNPTARVSVGKQISSDLSINYSTAFGETTESIVVVIEYTPEGPITYSISRDETGALAVDMKFRKSF